MESVLGVKGSALQWFESYLLGRKQRIKFNDDFSENQEILWSVPQGSVLGALSRMESVLGVKGSALQWFKSYLLGRKQRIEIQ